MTTKRKVLTLEEKVNAVNMVLIEKKRVKTVADEYGIPATTLHTYMKNREKIFRDAGVLKHDVNQNLSSDEHSSKDNLMSISNESTVKEEVYKNDIDSTLVTVPAIKAEFVDDEIVNKLLKSDEGVYEHLPDSRSFM